MDMLLRFVGVGCETSFMTEMVCCSHFSVSFEMNWGMKL